MASNASSQHGLTTATTPPKKRANAVNTISSASALSSASSNPISSRISKATTTPPTPHVAECLFEFLLGEILYWVEDECDPANVDSRRSSMKFVNNSVSSTSDGLMRMVLQPPLPVSNDTMAATTTSQSEEDKAILAAEMAAAKMERFGFGAGYRLCERLAQTKPLVAPTSPAPSIASAATPAGTSPGAVSGAAGSSDTLAATQLEAVKFLCKEFWMEVFRKQIDKLQTNHRGVFVLKDHELRWLRRLPSDDERARVAAIKLLAFPCGLIRGALANFGIMAVVSCDFLADGKNMAACSFNIKIKT
jgi:hypothetical protein